MCKIARFRVRQNGFCEPKFAPALEECSVRISRELVEVFIITPRAATTQKSQDVRS